MILAALVASCCLIVPDVETAIEQRDLVALRRAVEGGTAINKRDADGWYPLHRAVNKNWLEGVELLVDHGAVLEATTLNEGWTPLHVAASAWVPGSGVLEYLIAKGVDVNARGLTGETPLYAAAGRLAEPTRKLIAAGANPNLRGALDLLPIEWAIMWHKPDVVEELLRSATEVKAVAEQIRSGPGRVAERHYMFTLTSAIAEGDTRTVTLLRDHLGYESYKQD